MHGVASRARTRAAGLSEWARYEVVPARVRVCLGGWRQREGLRVSARCGTGLCQHRRALVCAAGPPSATMAVQLLLGSIRVHL